MSSSHNLTGLLLLGGLSTRMGKDKALLSYATHGTHGGGLGQTPVVPARTQLERGLQLLTPLCAGGVLISARDAAQRTRLRALVPDQTLPEEVQYVLDAPGKDVGPAAGLLAAHAARPAESFLVLAIDFPLATSAALSELVDAHNGTPGNPPVTCYMHTNDGNPEPFMSVWGLTALECLRKNVESSGKTGPCFSARQAWKEHDAVGIREGHGLVRPRDERWLVNTNTPEQWEAAVKRAALDDLTRGQPVE